MGTINGNKQVSDLIDTDVSIQWTEKTGKVTGKIKYVSDYSSAFGEKQKTGHFFPIKIDAKYYDQELTCTGRNDGDRNVTCNASDPYLIIRLENLSGNQATVKLKSSQEVIFILDFTSATKEEAH